MTTTTFGGGPTTAQRRAFAGLKEGAQVPGYRGYIPQIKYHMGNTYGNDTSAISQEFGLKRSVTIIGGVPNEVPDRKLPKATGTNKYTEKMIPGYTGYVPRMTFKFGDTYKRECDDCIDEFLTNRETHQSKQEELQRQTSSYPRLTAICHDPVVRDSLNMYRDTHPPQPILMEDKRGPVEPPLPGYMGFVPRIGPTEIGLGQRYHTRTQYGLDAFARDQSRHNDYLGSSTQPLTRSYTVSGDRKPAGYLTGEEMFNRRIYRTGGMVPRYTGYVPQRRYVFGNTYGDTTRSLEVCRHDKPSYSEFLKTKNFPLPIVPC